jgi:hypothetical protein
MEHLHESENVDPNAQNQKFAYFGGRNTQGASKRANQNGSLESTLKKPISIAHYSKKRSNSGGRNCRGCNIHSLDKHGNKIGRLTSSSKG